MSSLSRVRTDQTEFYQARVYRASDYFAVIELWKMCFPNNLATCNAYEKELGLLSQL